MILDAFANETFDILCFIFVDGDGRSSFQIKFSKLFKILRVK